MNLNGQWTVSDADLFALAHRMQEEGLIELVFAGRCVKTATEFVAAMKLPSNLVVFAYVDGEIAGVAWLNGISSTHGFGHFCFTRSAKGETVRIGRAILDYWKTFPSLEVIVGMIPASNERAIIYALKLGFTSLGSIPKMMEIDGMKTAGHVLYRDAKNF